MRPAPDEVIAGVRSLLRNLGSEVQSSAAQRDLRRAMYVLRELRCEQSAFDLLDENDRWSEALALIIDWTESQEDFEMFRSAARPLLNEGKRPRSFEEANARNLALRIAICGFLDRLPSEDLAESRALRSQLLELIGPRA